MSGEEQRFHLCRVKVVSADVPGFLSAVVKRGITIGCVYVRDPLTVLFSASYKDIGKIKEYAISQGAEVRVLHIKGLFQLGKVVLKRPVLLISILLLLLLTWFVPTRVLFIQVKGNSDISQKQILECAENAGLRWGISCKDIRSEQFKNKMLQMLPQLRWAGVTTKGCVVTVSVREGAVNNKTEWNPVVSHIVANTDGVITEMVTVSGNPICRVGQAVKKGQTLISGYWDLGLVIKATRSKGEIYAMTQHDISAQTPAEGLKRGELKKIEHHYSLLIGKKLINFNNSSGILPPGCVKICKYIPLSLSEGLDLPVTVLAETLYYYETEPVSELQDFSFLEDAAKKYLLQNMTAGTILQSTPQWESSNTVHMEYICHEMIGQEVAEERMDYNGENS